MDKNKILVVAGIGLIVVLAVTLFVRIISDDMQPDFSQAMSAQATVVELSNLAIRDADDANTKSLAAAIASTTASDRFALSRFYENSFDEKPPGAYQEPLTQLRQTREDFDEVYKDLVFEHLEISYQNLESLSVRINNPQFQEAVETAMANHLVHLEQLR